jgi:hypothetical protein
MSADSDLVSEETYAGGECRTAMLRTGAPLEWMACQR